MRHLRSVSGAGRRSRLAGAAVALTACFAIAAGCGSDSDDEGATEGEGLSGKVVRVGMPGVGLDDLAIWPTIQSLEEQGAEVEITEFAELQDVIVAMSRDEIDVATNMAMPSVVLGIEEGAPIKIVSSWIKNTNSLVARDEFQGPEELGGRTFGVHDEASFGKLLVDFYLQENDIDGEIVIVPGSENRAQAIGQGELDATTIGITDIVTVQRQYPDTVHLEETFAEDLPDLVAFALVARDGFVEEEPELARAFVEGVINGYRTLNSDRQAALEYASENYSDIASTPELLEEQVDLLIDGGYFPDDGLLTPETCEESIEFVIDLGQVPGLEGVDDDAKYCRYDLLDEALANLG